MDGREGMVQKGLVPRVGGAEGETAEAGTLHKKMPAFKEWMELKVPEKEEEDCKGTIREVKGQHKIRCHSNQSMCFFPERF